MYENNQQETSTLTVSIEELRARIEHLKIFERLEGNTDFQKGIIEGYLQKEPVRLVNLKADPTVIFDKDHEKDVDNQMLAVAYLRRYLITARRERETLERDLEFHLAEQAEQAQESVEAGGVFIGGGDPGQEQ